MLRTISGIILGYLLFALSAVVLFRVTRHDPHVPATIAFEVSAIVYGMLFALAAGYLGTWLAGRRDLLVAWIIAVIMAAGAVASMVAKGIGWSPMTALLFMVPAEVIGGYVSLKQGQGR